MSTKTVDSPAFHLTGSWVRPDAERPGAGVNSSLHDAEEVNWCMLLCTPGVLERITRLSPCEGFLCA